MRFCPFCSAENADELAVCQACGRRLPPLPPRRAGSKGQPTGIQLPPRAPSAAPPPIPAGARKPNPTVPPPIPSSGAHAVPHAPVAVPSSGAQTAPSQTAPSAAPVVAPSPASMVTPTAPMTAAPAGPMVARESAPALPPPPAPDEAPARQQLLDALSPPPAAERRPASPSQPPPVGGPERRRTDSKAPPLSPTAFAGTRPNSPSQPPPIARRASPSQPPPVTNLAPPPRPPTFGSETATPTSMSPPPAFEASKLREIGEPPPTRIHRADATDRPFTPPKVLPVPEIPEPGLVNAARYAYFFWRARWQRRGAIKQLGVEIKQDTEALDQVLGALGRAARGANVEGRVFSAENAAISDAEARIAALQKEHGEAEGRKAEENSKFVDVERERNEKLAEAERMVEEGQRELAHLEAQRRAERDKRKDLERRQKAHLKAAEDHDKQAAASQMGDQRTELRRTAEGHRREAAALEPERQELDRRLASLERPISEATAKLDAAKAELDAAKRSLNDAREGHTHRLAELDAEQKRKAREVALAESEIQRRLVTLGTLVNLNRIEDPRFGELYERIDRLRGAITARTTEIEKLTAEREAYDRGTLVRGVATIGGAFLALIALIVIFRAIL